MNLLKAAILLVAFTVAAPASAQKIYLNPSDQNTNPVQGGGVESTYALINANKAKSKLDALGGLTTRVDQDFYNAPGNANSWGAAIFISIHSNAMGSPNQAHGTETLWVSTGGKALATKVQAGLISKLPYANRGLVYRNNLWVLNATNMYACLTETVFHDCSTTSGVAGHPPSESAFLKSASGQDKIGAGVCQGAASYFGRTCTSTPPPPAKGTIKGVVYKNADLTQHIAGATVKLNTGATLTYDGGSGWSFSVNPGTYTVTASATGYATASKTVTVAAGATSWSSIELKPVATKGTISGAVCRDAVSSTCTKISGATVQLNTGAKVTYNGTTNWSFDVAPGTYTVMASAVGFQTATKTGVVVTAGAQVSASVALKANPVTTTGGISGYVFRTDTQEHLAASVEVNPGAKTASCTAAGTWTLSNLPVGTYTVTASAAGFQDQTETVDVTAGATATLNIGLAPETGWLKGVVFRNPDEADEIGGATVQVGDKSVTFNAGTPWAFELPAGTYEVKASAASFTEATVSATVVAGQETIVDIGLDSTVVAQHGTFKGIVYADPDKTRLLAGATVVLNDGSLVTYDGQNDWTLEVPPGTYTVTASADGYLAGSVEKTVAAGETVVVELGLLVDGVESQADAGTAGAADAGTAGAADAGHGSVSASGCGVPGTASPMLIPLLVVAAGWRLRRRA